MILMEMNEVKQPHTLEWYHNAAMRTADPQRAKEDLIRNAALGLCGESGEVADIIKKVVYQGHPADPDRLIEEAGDVLWYVALLAEGLGLTLEDIAVYNIKKLEKRYPNGFEAERSVNRGE